VSDTVNVVVELRSWFLRYGGSRPYLAIDGRVHQRAWGTHHLVLSVGRHRIEAWYPTMLIARTNLAAADLDVEPGATYRLRYQPSLWPFGAGSMELVTAELPVARLVPP
jgi:hypothetical protein